MAQTIRCKGLVGLSLAAADAMPTAVVVRSGVALGSIMVSSQMAATIAVAVLASTAVAMLATTGLSRITGPAPSVPAVINAALREEVIASSRPTVARRQKGEIEVSQVLAALGRLGGRL